MYRLIAKDTIEEAILQCAQSKLRLEQDMAASDKGTSYSYMSAAFYFVEFSVHLLSFAFHL